MPAYFGDWRILSDQPVLPGLVASARKLVGGMLETKARLSDSLRLEDGSTIHATIATDIPRVTITQPTPKATQEFGVANMWVPRGFVVYPAWNDAPFGVGLPIIADTDPDAGPYDASNVAPGLDRDRWTVGGPCGEVLMSADAQAGYPHSEAIPAPLMFQPTRGPVLHWINGKNYDSRSLGKDWASYRLELASFVAHYADENTARQQALFEAVNSARDDASVTQATLRFRGFGRPAEIAASLMLVNGTDEADSDLYPPTYRHAYDRITKEGYSVDWTDAVLSSFTRADTFGMTEFRDDGSSVDDAVAAWGTQAGGVLTADLGPCVVADIGWRGGYGALALTVRDRWIHAGNANWQSADPTLPPISWHSFASMNLAWETYPAQFDPVHVSTAPLLPIYAFTGPTGDCWLQYPRAATLTPSQYEPALSRHVYSRGRSIALAPRGGLVWAVGVIANGDTDRLVALIHHPEDQPADYTAEGFTRYLRVWWADIPKRPNIRLAPQQVICGEAADDDWAWRGGTLLDLGAAPAPAVGPAAAASTANSLKYASCWRFAADGKSAVCLRDYGTMAEYSVAATANNHSWLAALRPRAVELLFTVDTDATGVDLVWHDYVAGMTAADRLLVSPPPDTTAVFDLAMYEQGAVPIAVDYDNGKVVYAYSARVASHQDLSYNPAEGSDGGVGFLAIGYFSYVGIGDATAKYATDMQQRVLCGGRFKTPDINVYAELAQVHDVASAAFTIKVTRPRFSVDPANALNGGLTLVDTPCQTFTTEKVDGVRMYRAGKLLFEDWYPSPDGALFAINDLCFTSLSDVNATQVYLPLAVSANVQGFYATRFGEYVFSYQCSPMPNAVPVLSAEPSSTACGCGVTSVDFDGTGWLPNSALNPRGGRAVASVPLPDADWLIYSKVV